MRKFLFLGLFVAAFLRAQPLPVSTPQAEGFSPERLATTWQAIAESQDLDPKWDPNQAFDTSLVPDK